MLTKNDLDAIRELFIPVYEKLDSHSDAIAELKAEVKQNNADILELKSAVTQNSADIANLRTEVDGLRTDVDGLRTEVDGLRTDVGGLHTEVDGLHTEVGGLRADVGELRIEVRHLNDIHENEMRPNIRIIAECHTDLYRNLKEAQKPSQDIELLKIKVNVLESDVAKIKQKIS